MFSANSSLGITLLALKYYFMAVKLLFFDMVFIDLTKEIMLCIRLLLTKCLTIQIDFVVNLGELLLKTPLQH